MVTRVRLRGLNITANRDKSKWFVYVRATGECLLKGFGGTRADLDRRMAEPDFIDAYNRRRKQSIVRNYPDDTLGGLVHWWLNEAPEFDALADATKNEYRAALEWLEPEYDLPLREIDQAGVYEVRDSCAKAKWPRFADKMVAALSSMFSRAVKRRKMQTNPAKGVERLSRSDPNANREWKPWEQQGVFSEAPPHILTPLMVARYAGFRGQSIQPLTWRQYQKDPLTGRAFNIVSAKNGEAIWMPVVPALQAHLSAIDATSTHICTRADGTPWPSVVTMQTAVSHFLKRMERDGKADTGITLHGLRVTFAAALRRDGADRGMVASALGDRSERMGTHYTRHVEREAQVTQALKGHL